MNNARLPPLPENFNGGWSADVYLAYQLIETAFGHGLTLLHQEDGEPLRLNLASERLVNESVPLLEQLERQGIPTAFTFACAHAIGPLVCELKLAALAAQGIERQNVTFLEPVEIVHTGKRGRPEKRINIDLLKEAFTANRNISQKDLAAALHVHRNVLGRKMKAAGISKKFEEMTDDDLDALVRAGHPEEEDDWYDDPEPLVEAVTDDLAHNIRHPAIKVARHKNPFRSPVIEGNFFAALDAIVEQGIVPDGYGVLEKEWDGDYPAMEAINPGTRGKEILVALPREIWLPRAILFVQALDAMTRCLVFEEGLGDAGAGNESDSSSSSQEDID
ncbi:hypothetical protein MVEN_02177600 [Mycena venus]|uniref:Uncharacterized protein n=1 Tax=Mycena venus TaxID=2733690 RepID=A0A8H6X8A5_9AGAR|nr:hypothetical protein MVEN_02177600 [Mycena venus]